MRWIICCLATFFLFLNEGVYSYAVNEQHYDFSNELIDVVIPCTYKDLDTLELCIKGIKQNCRQIRRVIVISAEKLTDNAEWFDEDNYPFDKNAVALHLFKGNQTAASEYLRSPGSRVGWYYQQLLKIYAPFVIPDISANVLLLDSDTIFLNPVNFLNASFAGLYNPGTEYNPAYFYHAGRLTQNKVKKLYPQYSGISHHMLIQRCVLEDLFDVVESFYHNDFWKVFCLCVDPKHLFAGASEYEIYFNFVLSRSKKVEVRRLRWANINNINDVSKYKADGFHYVSCHDWLRQ